MGENGFIVKNKCLKIKFEDIKSAGLVEAILRFYESKDKYVETYAQNILEGDIFPPIKFYEDTTIVADGLHRIAAYLLNGIDEFEYTYL